MGSIDGLREQVEELKQRLNGPGEHQAAEPNELKARLASIKAGLEGKQNEIARLTAEKEQLLAAKDQFAAEMQQQLSAKEQLAAEKQQLAAEKQQLAAENDQLRKMLGEVLSVIDGRSTDDSASILREFIAETDPLIESAGDGSGNVIAAGPPADHATANPGKTGSAEAGPREQAARVAAAVSDAPGDEAQPQDGPQSADKAAEEESPALRRIMKRGRRAG